MSLDQVPGRSGESKKKKKPSYLGFLQPLTLVRRITRPYIEGPADSFKVHAQSMYTEKEFGCVRWTKFVSRTLRSQQWGQWACKANVHTELG